MGETNPNSRLEAFSDGVFAIALTLLIIEIRIPSSVRVDSTHDLWLALWHIGPSIFSFLLSFAIILITWVNHHAALKLVSRSSAPFIYANGLLLLGVVFIPFPTALMGEYLSTDHSAPAVVLYSAVCAFQSIGWILMSRAALKPDLLTKNEKSTQAVRQNQRYGYLAVAVYTILAIVAFWFPRSIAIAISLIWIFWLIWGLNIKDE